MSDWSIYKTSRFLSYADEPTATPSYERTWYDDYDEYGMSMCMYAYCTCKHNIYSDVLY